MAVQYLQTSLCARDISIRRISSAMFMNLRASLRGHCVPSEAISRINPCPCQPDRAYSAHVLRNAALAGARGGRATAVHVNRSGGPFPRLRATLPGLVEVQPPV